MLIDNVAVILMAHDRGTPLCYQVNIPNYGCVLSNHLFLLFQYFLTKNAQFRGEIPTVVSFGTRLNGKHSASFGR